MRSRQHFVRFVAKQEPAARCSHRMESTAALLATLVCGAFLAGTQCAAQTIIEPTVTQQATSISLTPGAQTYIYGFATGGEFPSTPFVNGSGPGVYDTNGNLATSLAVSAQSNNSYSTSTLYQAISGVGVSGFTNMEALYSQYVVSGAGNVDSGSNQTPPINFTLIEPSLVLALGLGSSQQTISFQGPAGLITDQAANSGVAAGIAHAYLAPGTYTIQQTTSVTAAGQTLNNMTDLLGVYFFSDSPRPGGVQVNTNAGNVGGTIRIQSGTGTFAGVSDANNTITVSPGASLSGQVMLTTDNVEGSASPGSIGPAIAPLIFTPSWGNPQTSWQNINSDIVVGSASQTANVLLSAPATPGVYHVNFAFAWEIGDDHVASGTNWATGTDVWGDGNDIASLTAAQIEEGQQLGYTDDYWLGGRGYTHLYIPMDAITVDVVPEPSLISLLAVMPMLLRRMHWRKEEPA
jgi:hypothetical protein